MKNKTEVEIYWFACYDEIDDKLRVWKLSGKPWGTRGYVQLTYILGDLCGGARRVPGSLLSKTREDAVAVWRIYQTSKIAQAKRRLERENEKLNRVRDFGFTEYDISVASSKKMKRKT